MKNYDVLIVGCGPVGGTLANLLRQKGHEVAIFERDKDVFHAPRAMQIDAESCRIFQELGVMERLVGKDARPSDRHIFVDEKRQRLMELRMEGVPQTLGHPAPGMRFHQPALEKLLREDFEKGVGVDAYLGYEVLEVEGDGPAAKVQARNADTGETSEFTGQYLVGSDGGGSLCRKHVGGQRVDFNYSRRWIVIDIIVHDDDLWNGLIDRSEFMCRANSAVVFVKGCNNHVRFDFEVTDEVAESFTEQDARDLISNYFETSSIEFLRVAPYHFYAGMPDKWRSDRVLVAGDAAHLTSPFSGQGLNMGIRDAANLGFKLDLILKGLVSDKFLDSYQEERWDHCAGLIEGATARGLMISRTTFLGKLKRNLSFFIGQNFPKMALAMTAKMSNMHAYKGGLVGDHLLSGTQMIQPFVTNAEGDDVLLDDVIGGNFALISTHIEVGADMDWFKNDLGGKVLVLGDTIEDRDGKLAQYFAENEISSVLIRPDRYLFSAGAEGVTLVAGLRAGLQVYR
ncbi:MAG: FAD-dependent monooxygenase [Henriciella sp.]